MNYRRLPVLLLVLAIVLPVAFGSALADEPAAIEKRLADWARYLASDALEGRGVGTKGLEQAADYIAAQFGQSGLKTAVLAGTPFQKFTLAIELKRGPNNRLTFEGPATGPAKPERIELKLDADYNPLAIGGSGKLDLPLVLVGYGISGKEEKYDDYAGIDVAGKAVVILRHEPQQGDPKSVFNGVQPSVHAPFARKVANARDHKAAAVVFCSDDFDVHRSVAEARKKWQEALDKLAEEYAGFKKVANPSFEQIESQRKRIDDLSRQVTAASERIRAEFDPVLPFEAGGRDPAGPPIPIIYCRRSLVDKMTRAALRTELAAIERQIDAELKPRSAELKGWRVSGEVQVERTVTEVRNVVAVLEGEGPLADETVVIGAHYDHIGFRAPESPGGAKVILNGADDNASGVAVTLEVARQLAQRKAGPRRRLVFIAFTAEERGLLGSKHYVDHPPFPLQKTVAMFNLDMVGRLRDNKLTIGGSGSSPGFEKLLDTAAPRCALQLTKHPAGHGPSDQLPFYNQKMPVMHFFTGLHPDYHKPSDDFEKLNVEGMRRIAGMVTEVVAAVAGDAKRPEYVPLPPPKPPAPAKQPSPPKPPV
jgi:hypothetical protein